MLSISKLIADNNLFVEFHANFCFVKDKETGKVILQGKLKDGLYQFQLPKSQSKTSNIQCANKESHLSHLVCVAVPTHESKSTTSGLATNSVNDEWHRRLGHTSQRVASLIFKYWAFLL